MKEADRCCGAAGSFNLTYYDLANKVGHRKVCNIKDTGANVVTTECPSCIMQIRHLIELEQIPVEVTHLAELISKSYGGVS
jgi:glycolate oxidase iron-sulfur subunit